MMKYDCVIIGAGMSGLAAAIRMAHYEKKVCVCESHSRLGGLNSYYTREGIELESGLHAMTNFAPARANGAPLNKLLRQLRIPYDALAPREQNYSLIRFPDAELRFSNDFNELRDSIAVSFPKQSNNFAALDKMIIEWNETNLSNPYLSAKSVITKFISDPLLSDMLFCPLMYYGSASENDMDFSQFAIMYKSIFKEGFFRPAAGIHGVIDILAARAKEAGAEIRTGCRIKSILHHNGHATGVVTAEGEIIYADKILSTAGVPETVLLTGSEVCSDTPPGQLAFMETIAIPNSETVLPKATIIFFNESNKFTFANPAEPVSTASGVICLPQNFRLLDNDVMPPRCLRSTVLANHRAWFEFQNSEYESRKQNAAEMIIEKSYRIAGISDAPSRLLDAFTPRTIYRYTGKINGAIYGSPIKCKPGITKLDNLHIAGTDQGFLGITGALLSGISISNLHLLR